MSAIQSEGLLGELDASLYKLIFDSTYDGVYFVDAARRILMWNAAAERITGYPAKAVVGRFCYENMLSHMDRSGQFLCQAGCPLERAMQNNKPRAARVTLKHSDGHRIAVDVSVAPIQDRSGAVVGAVEIFRDVSAYERLEAANERIAKLTYQDYLTGIANRREVARTLEREIRRAKRYSEDLGVLMIDVDKFKRINDEHGHAVGDSALKRIARALARAVRDSDELGRFGGDEFFVVAPSTAKSGLDALAERARSKVEVAGSHVPGGGVTVSIGGACLKRDEQSKTLLARADGALYEAKRAGGNVVVIK